MKSWLLRNQEIGKIEKGGENLQLLIDETCTCYSVLIYSVRLLHNSRFIALTVSS